MNLEKVLQSRRNLHVAGVDDAHNKDRARGVDVSFSAIEFPDGDERWRATQAAGPIH